MTEAIETQPKPPRSKLRRFAQRVIVIAITVYICLCALVFFAQDWLAFPGKSEQGTPQTRIHYSGNAEVLDLHTADGIPIKAVYGSVGDPAAPTILYFYGNAGAVAWSEGEFDHFRKLGCNVLIPDLAGYGASGGSPSEKNFYATADAAWEYLQHRNDINHNKIITLGWSMGAGIAIDLAARKPVAGVATFNAFTTLPAMAHQLFKWMPTSLLLRYRFDNESKIKMIRAPVFICNGARDTLVPPQMSDDLAKTAAGHATRLVIPTADHNTIFEAEPNMIWPTLGDWIQKEVIHSPIAH